MSDLKERKCTACGGTLKIDGNKAVCEYCGSTYDIEEGVSVKEVSITNIGNLLKRGREYLEKNDFKKAKEYLEKAKDIDIENQGVKVFEQELTEQEKNYFSAKEAMDSIEYQEHLKKEEKEKKQREIDKKIKDFGKVEEATLEKLNNTIWKCTSSERYYIFKNGLMYIIKAKRNYDGEKEYTEWKQWWTKIEKIGHKFYQDKEYLCTCYRPKIIKDKKNNEKETLDSRCLETNTVSNYTVKNNYDIDAYYKFDIAGDKYLIEHIKYRDSNYSNINYMIEADRTYEKIEDLEALKYFEKISDIEEINKKERNLEKKTRVGKFFKPYLILCVVGFIIGVIINTGINSSLEKARIQEHLMSTLNGTTPKEINTDISLFPIYLAIILIVLAVFVVFYARKRIKLNNLNKEKQKLENEAIEIQKRINEYQIDE